MANRPKCRNPNWEATALTLVRDWACLLHSTDNGAEKFSWPEGCASTFRCGKNENWVPSQEYIAKYVVTFAKFPPSQKAGSFRLDQVLKNLAAARASGQ